MLTLKENHYHQHGAFSDGYKCRIFTIRGIRLSTFNKMSFPGRPFCVEEVRRNGQWCARYMMYVASK
jgi:hypothetical protein